MIIEGSDKIQWVEMVKFVKLTKLIVQNSVDSTSSWKFIKFLQISSKIVDFKTDWPASSHLYSMKKLPFFHIASLRSNLYTTLHISLVKFFFFPTKKKKVGKEKWLEKYYFYSTIRLCLLTNTLFLFLFLFFLQKKFICCLQKSTLFYLVSSVVLTDGT